MVKLYSGFRLPVTARIFFVLFLIVGIAFLTMRDLVGVLMGVPLVFVFLIPWGLLERADFDVNEKAIIIEITFFGLRLKKKIRKVTVNHITMNRVMMKSTNSIGRMPGGGAVIEMKSTNYQYSVQLIFNGNERELLESVAGLEDTRKLTFDLAKKLGVKIFDATETPQKWVDPFTGKETIAEFKRKR